MDGGFFELDPLMAGEYLTIRRDSTMQGNNRYSWCQIMLYQTPNLISKYSNVVQMTSDTSVAVAGWEAKNLLQNLENRISGYD